MREETRFSIIRIYSFIAWTNSRLIKSENLSLNKVKYTFE
jgi:hypothetical protein